MNNELTPEAARNALVSAAAVSEKMRARARWASTKLAIFGIGIGLVAATVGLVESKAVGAAVFAGWIALVVGMTIWERGRLAHLAGTRQRINPYWIGSFACYGVALAVGTGELSGVPMYWIPASVIVALPMLIGALRERRA
ncbi:hypothetical protein [Micromonospora pattaloongensis]|uniref:hypothetical protein n=1 Tax=Micromonospora pattaloongensis TaxID=405436 RepID=UPI000B810D2E|nr:hypothetical protein [Micromonospora pattaloongensis]